MAQATVSVVAVVAWPVVFVVPVMVCKLAQALDQQAAPRTASGDRLEPAALASRHNALTYRAL